MNQLKIFVRECVSHYATCNEKDGFYSLDIYDLPDFVQHEFAAIIMTDDNAWATEATGPDNKQWESKMLPALTRYLKDTTHKDEEIEFNHIWRECVTSYCHEKMQSLLDDGLQEYNSKTSRIIKDHSQYYGVTHLF
jgi:hypothetical protein